MRSKIYEIMPSELPKAHKYLTYKAEGSPFTYKGIIQTLNRESNGV